MLRGPCLVFSEERGTGGKGTVAISSLKSRRDAEGLPSRSEPSAGSLGKLTIITPPPRFFVNAHSRGDQLACFQTVLQVFILDNLPAHVCTGNVHFGRATKGL